MVPRVTGPAERSTLKMPRLRRAILPFGTVVALRCEIGELAMSSGSGKQTNHAAGDQVPERARLVHTVPREQVRGQVRDKLVAKQFERDLPFLDQLVQVRVGGDGSVQEYRVPADLRHPALRIHLDVKETEVLPAPKRLHHVDLFPVSIHDDRRIGARYRVTQRSRLVVQEERMGVSSDDDLGAGDGAGEGNVFVVAYV